MVQRFLVNNCGGSKKIHIKYHLHVGKIHTVPKEMGSWALKLLVLCPSLKRWPCLPLCESFQKYQAFLFYMQTRNRDTQCFSFFCLICVGHCIAATPHFIGGCWTVHLHPLLIFLFDCWSYWFARALCLWSNLVLSLSRGRLIVKLMKFNSQRLWFVWTLTRPWSGPSSMFIKSTQLSYFHCNNLRGLYLSVETSLMLAFSDRLWAFLRSG